MNHENASIEEMNQKINEHIAREVERRCEEWLAAAHGKDWVAEFSRVNRENRRLQAEIRRLKEFEWKYKELCK